MSLVTKRMQQGRPFLGRTGIRALVTSTLVGVIALVIAGIVSAQAGPSRTAPRESATPPVFVQNAQPQPSHRAPLPEHRRWMGLDEMRNKLGGTLLLPSTLPPGCVEQERFFADGPQLATVLYSCMGVSLRAGGIAIPAVAPGSAQAVQVDGQSATYIGGAWRQNTDGTTTWAHGRQEVVVERDGLMILLYTFGGNLGVPTGNGGTQQIPDTWQLSRDDLLRIAESLAPVP